MKITKKLATKLHEGTRKEGSWEAGKIRNWEKTKRKKIKICVICVICGFSFFIFSTLPFHPSTLHLFILSGTYKIFLRDFCRSLGYFSTF